MTQREQMNILRELRTQRTRVKKKIEILSSGTHTALSQHGIKLLHQEVDRLAAEIDAVASEKVVVTA